MGLKLDMSKAHDRVEWNFLHAMCSRLGFACSWIDLVMRCVTSVRYSILLNGQLTESFSPLRGLRQGDPLSPYLFLLCAEGFSALIKQAERGGRLTGFRIARTAPPIFHLFFADDSVLFFKSTQEEVSVVKEIIATYEGASGQRVNLNKSELFVSGNVDVITKCERGMQLRAQTVDYYTKYLGLPTLVGRSKKQVFQVVVERVINRLKGWKERNLTKARREVLIKSVIQSIPTYAMSCFLFPRSLCEEIDKAFTRFFWGATDKDRKVHWSSWERISRSKVDGGMGFREIFFFNLAMVAKQYWRIQKNPNTLVSQILKARYFPSSCIEKVILGYQPSFLWRSMLNARGLVEAGTAWKIGNGDRVKCYKDRWIGVTNPTCPKEKIGRDTSLTKVADFIDWDLGGWNVQKIRECFTEEDVKEILKIPLMRNGDQDESFWRGTKQGKYSVKSAYKIAIELFSKCGRNLASSSNKDNIWKKIWRCKVAPKVNHFMWRVCMNNLPTNDNLIRVIKIDSTYLQCGEEMETITHILFKFPHAAQVWRLCPLRMENNLNLSAKHLIVDLIDTLPMEGQMVLFIVAWQIWKHRNAVLF